MTIGARELRCDKAKLRPGCWVEKESAMTGMLKRKVVVISGVGPGLGTTLAHRCARDGADLVLAARTLERLEEVAKQVNDSGHRALAVRADITDDDEVSKLVEATMDAYGKVDVLVNNAFRVPSMKPLAGTTFQHIRDAIELSALGALRLVQAFTPALESSGGSIVNVNSMVLRHSQAKYGAYKMAKSALLAMSQSLATELGEKGIRVNSVAPGYIWGDTLQSYFEHQAGKYGTTVDQIYQATAANSDLKRLPTEDEVASAILFLASDLSSGITGQTLDVNCGEYHS
jgi:NAD(P)-dependent dehydrogenase (short-subunit alcohol dehydrogenase family)